MAAGVVSHAVDTARNGPHHPAEASGGHGHCPSVAAEVVQEATGAGGHPAAGVGEGYPWEGHGRCCQVEKLLGYK